MKTLIWVTAKRPFEGKTWSGERVFQPGEIFQVNKKGAEKFLKWRVLREAPNPLKGLAVGALVQWQSPRGLLMTGIVKMIGEGALVVDIGDRLLFVHEGFIKRFVG